MGAWVDDHTPILQMQAIMSNAWQKPLLSTGEAVLLESHQRMYEVAGMCALRACISLSSAPYP